MPDTNAKGAGLSRPLLLAYGLPGLPLAAIGVPLYVYLPAFYAEELGLGLASVGGALLIARIWDLFTDPLMGRLSDALRTPWGRRRPWMLLGVPILLISAWFLFLPAQAPGFIYLTAWTMALYLGSTMILLPYSAWGAELSQNYNERSRIAAWREGFVVVGTVIAAALPSLVGDDRSLTLEWLFIGILVALPLCVAATCLSVNEPAIAQKTTLPWRRSVAILLRNGPFLRLVSAYFLNGIAIGLPSTLFLLYVKFGLEAESWTGPLLLTYFVCGIAALPLWLRLASRIGKHRAWCLAMLLACGVFIWVPLLGPGDTWAFLVVCILSGFALGADLALPPAIQADVIDLDSLHSRRQRAGVYFGLWGIATKLALALAVGLSFPLLDLAGFTPAAEQPGAVWALALLYGLAPVVFKLAAILLVWNFPITAQRQHRIRALINRRESRRSTTPEADDGSSPLLRSDPSSLHSRL
ncbi:MFS transporter [Pelagibius litoralis]|uniref:MFS transporter n=1 Tax=Pelagibius litoralis TaxID=374515 RepID=A0A967F330_9PROT|nr:MFS transporter [Pelagibius litoralis]NIA72113.1 MFS transporter [Pelagibius litoralis]